MPTTAIHNGDNIVSIINSGAVGTSGATHDYVVDAGAVFRTTGSINLKAWSRILGPTDGSTLPIINRSLLLSTWTHVGSQWRATYSGGPLKINYSYTLYNPQANYAEMVLFDGIPLWKAGVTDAAVDIKTTGSTRTKTTIVAGECWIDYDANLIYIGTDPTGHVLEVTQGGEVIAASGDNSTVDHIVAKGGATGHGILGNNNWTITNNVLTCNSIGFHSWDGSVMTDNLCTYNGRYGYQHKGVGGQLRRNEVHHCDWQQGLQSNHNPNDSGATKVYSSTDCIVDSENIHDNFSNGWWMDINNIHPTLTNMRCFNNGQSNDPAAITNELMMEIAYGSIPEDLSKKGLISGCTVDGNGNTTRGIYVSTTRNFLVSGNDVRGCTGKLIDVFDDAGRTNPTSGGVAHRGINNVVSGNHQHFVVGAVVSTADQGARATNQPAGDTQVWDTNVWNSSAGPNIYDLPTPEGTHFRWQGVQKNHTQWQAIPQDVGAVFNFPQNNPNPPTLYQPRAATVGGTVAGAAAATSSVTIDASALVGDVLHVAASINAGNDTITAPAGWNAASVSTQSDGTGSGATLATFTRVCQAGDANTAVTFSSTTAHRWDLVCSVWPGIDNATTLDTASPLDTHLATNALSFAGPAVTPATSGTVYLISAVHRALTSAVTPPALTLPADLTPTHTVQQTTVAGGNNISLVTAYKFLTSSAAVAAETITSDLSGQWVIAVDVLRPTPPLVRPVAPVVGVKPDETGISTSPTGHIPTEAQAGDELIAFLCVRFSGGTPAITVPANWQQATTQLEPTASPIMLTRSYRKVMQASDTPGAAISWGLGTTPLAGCVVIIAVRGYDTTDPLDQHSTLNTNGAASSTVSFPTVTTTADGEEVIAVSFAAAGVDLLTPAQGQIEDLNVRFVSKNPNNLSVAICHFAQATAGATGTFSWQLNGSAQTTSHLLTLKPAASPPPPPPPPPPPGAAGLTGTPKVTSSATTSVVAALPDNIVTGEIVLAHVTARSATANPSTSASGWTLLKAQANTVPSVSLRSAVYWKIVTAGSETAPTFSAAGATSMQATLQRVTGVSGVQASNVGASTGASTNALSVGGLSSIGANDLELLFASASTGPIPYARTGCQLGVMSYGDASEWSKQAHIATFEGIVGRKVGFAHHMIPVDPTFDGITLSSQTNIADDIANFRLLYLGWPRPRTVVVGQSSWQSVWGTVTDPSSIFADMAAGTATVPGLGKTYNQLFDDLGTQLKGLGVPVILRLFWEQNQGQTGAGISWGVRATTDSKINYTANFNNAWRNLVTRVRAIAGNVLISWNPSPPNAPSGATPAWYPTWGDLYPGDDVVDFVGPEMYLNAGETWDTQAAKKVDNIGGGGGSGATFYAAYGPGSVHNKLFAQGEAGTRYANGDTAAQHTIHATSAASALPSTYSGWKLYCYWENDTASQTSALENLTGAPYSASAATATAIKSAFATWLSSAYMRPSLQDTWNVPPDVTYWTEGYQTRRETDTAGTSAHTCAGPDSKVIGQALWTAVGNPNVGSSVSVGTLGYGHMTAIRAALIGAGSPPPPPVIPVPVAAYGFESIGA